MDQSLASFNNCSASLNQRWQSILKGSCSSTFRGYFSLCIRMYLKMYLKNCVPTLSKNLIKISVNAYPSSFIP